MKWLMIVLVVQFWAIGGFWYFIFNSTKSPAMIPWWASVLMLPLLSMAWVAEKLNHLYKKLKRLCNTF